MAGKTSWNFWQLFNYSLEGIVNFSEAPLHIAFLGGLLSWMLAFILVVFIVVRTLVFGDPTSGWPSLMTVILFIGGFQLLTIGILGKYIGKVFTETKKGLSTSLKRRVNKQIFLLFCYNIFIECLRQEKNNT